MKFELLTLATVAFGLEFLLRTLVGDWWPWFMTALNMSLYVLVIVIPDCHYA
jgi:hypothetical protein